ncbi:MULTISPECIES: ParB/RepB/Spo0J family partition protein [Glutamicibacter]|jgi:ParB family chromosome partitioning protein|uniref:Chromosome partitioning protein ParB n=1 Tax=Glutamicibacter arilaitensis TaxID=256701 RepID=A0A2N7S114_9MICC|nr:MULTISPECIES: ParB/RepB/Spo0J family partition protein [Glutamicibacter]PMQ19842.1 chromosome partitioning protein ParB [Glutamicibacter arilaitensis]HCJ55301.1 ParB/RepB/Spo0J family partition protein [Glutamicibacter sp.]
MADKKRGLGRGLGALISSSPSAAVPEEKQDVSRETKPIESAAEASKTRATRPVDMFFEPGRKSSAPKAPVAPSKPTKRARATMPGLSTTLGSKSATVQHDDLQTEKQAIEKADSQEVAATSPELVEVPGAQFAELDVTLIHPNRKQPRSNFDQEHMDELIHSIREIGLLQPIVVRPSREKDDVPYELVMGERRWRATQAAGLSTIPAIIRDTQDTDLLRDALLENLHRSQLNPLEEAAAYQQLLEEFECTQEVLSDRIGRSRSQISNTIRLMKLPPLVQRRVAAGVLSAGHARALLGLSNNEAIEQLAQRIINEGLSVRATEEAVALSDDKPRKPAKKARETQRNERLDFLATSLSDRLDTNVKIQLGSRKGKVSIEFASVDDLNRIMQVIDPTMNS